MALEFDLYSLAGDKVFQRQCNRLILFLGVNEKANCRYEKMEPFGGPGRDWGIDGKYTGIIEGEHGVWDIQVKFYRRDRLGGRKLKENVEEAKAAGCDRYLLQVSA